MALGSAGRLFIGGFCQEPRCGRAFILVNQHGDAHGVRYCTPGCSKRARKQRKKSPVAQSMPCPTEGCPYSKEHEAHLVCAMCWVLAISMCRGKRRLDASTAMAVGRRRNMSDYGCPFCPGWHNGKPVDNPDATLQAGFRVARAIRERLGEQRAQELFDSWAPYVCDRDGWKRFAVQRDQALGRDGSR